MIILLDEKFLQFDLLRAVQLNLKYLHVKITNLLCGVHNSAEYSVPCIVV